MNAPHRNNVIPLHRVVQLPVRTLDDIVRENRDAWPYDESECVEDMTGLSGNHLIRAVALSLGLWVALFLVAYFAMQGFRAVFL